MDTCMLCKEASAVAITTNFDTDVRKVKCPRCGTFRITEEAHDLVQGADFSDRRYLLSAIARGAFEEGHSIEITTKNVGQLTESARPPSTVFEALDRLLLYIGTKAASFGELLHLSSNDYPIIFAQNPAELSYLRTHLIGLGYLKEGSGGNFQLTIGGWQKLEQLREARPSSKRAFVAMWFDQETEQAWKEGFKPALAETGYEPVRIDLIPHNEKICDRIVAELRGSGLVVADFTGNRGGVYFEAGFAMGHGIPVIWTCRDDAVEGLHFDTRQYNHIVWEAPAGLREQLIDRIRATLPAPQE